MSNDDISGTEKEKMLAGALYLASDPELARARRRARRLCRLYNLTREDGPEERTRLLQELFGRLGPRAEIEPSFQCDYGTNIEAGAGLYLNFGCVILDCARVLIGDNVLMGPGVHIYTAHHPLDPEIRASGRELASPVTIEDNVWLSGGVIVCPGVTIGRESVIGAGSVVTRDVPPRVVAVGNPCRVVRPLPDRTFSGDPRGSS